MEELKELAHLSELAIKLGKCRYNIFHAVVWAIYGMAFGGTTILASPIAINFRAYWLYGVAACATFVGSVYLVSMLYRRYVSASVREVRRASRIYGVSFASSFLAVYTVWGLLGDMYVLSTYWYPALGLALTLSGAFADRELVRRGYLVSNSELLVGPLTLGTSPLVYAPYYFGV